MDISKWRMLLVVVLVGWTLHVSVFQAIGQPGTDEAPAEPLTRILFVFDASGSMGDHWQSDTKYRIAVSILSQILDSLKTQPHLQTGLRVYGPRRDAGDDCLASYLMVPFAKGNEAIIPAILKGLKPEGSTPIAYSLGQTVTDFTPCRNCRNIVILITDGREACEGDPCTVSLQLQKEGIFLRPFIVGIGENLRTHFDCMGLYADALNEEACSHALNRIVNTALKRSTAQVWLLDEKGQPTQTNVHVTLFNSLTGKAQRSFMHTLDVNGIPDTLELDPLVPYDVLVQTIPPVKQEQVWIEPGEHAVVSLEVPQGFLSFGSTGNPDYPCVIRCSGSGEAIHVQLCSQRERYLAGTYDITVLSQPRMNFSGVIISPDAETRLSIPTSGRVLLTYSVALAGDVYLKQEENLLWVCRLRGDSNHELLNLQPGNYITIWKPLSARSNDDTQELSFGIESGRQTELRIEN